MKEDLRCFFEPESIAVIGASNDPGKSGYQIVRNLIDLGYQGKLYPVNPKLEELFGLKCYPTVDTIPFDVECIVVTVPAPFVPDVFKRAESKGGVKTAVVIASGFSETKIPERIDLEKRFLEVAKRANIRVMGPNCVGVMNTAKNLDTTFADGIIQSPGKVSIISQSGAFGAAMLTYATNQPVPMGFAKWAHVGNQKDVTVLEILKYYKDDPDTSVIIMYMEGIENAEEFIRVAEEVSLNKSILILKVGRSEEGAKAASSHTGSLAGSDALYEGTFRQAGVIRVQTLHELLDAAKSLSMQPLPKGNRILVLTEAGGPGIIAMDTLGLSSEYVPAHLTDKTIKQLRECLPPMAIIDHTPGYVDMSAAAYAEHHARGLQIALEDPNVDGIVHLSVLPSFLDPEEIANEVIKLNQNTTKPITICYMGGDGISEARRLFEKANLPTYDTPDQAARAMVNMLRRKEALERRQAEQTNRQQSGAKIAISEANLKVIDQAAQSGQGITEEVSRSILTDCRIPLLPAELAADVETGVQVAEKIGYPVVMKIVSPQILHKSDVGGVKVNVKDEATFRQSWQAILDNIGQNAPAADIKGILVMKQAREGTEIIVGANRDRQLGPVIMVGFGGVYVEILKDVTFGGAPLSKEQALDMIRNLKMYPALEGARGGSKGDIDSLANLLVSLGDLMTTVPRISEIDLNPVRVYEDSIVALDSRILCS